MPNPPHISIAGDGSPIGTSLAWFLAADGFRVSAAEDGVSMCAAMENARFDLIVPGTVMPGEDGLSLCRRLRATSKAPVVLPAAVSGETGRIAGLIETVRSSGYAFRAKVPAELRGDRS